MSKIVQLLPENKLTEDIKSLINQNFLEIKPLEVCSEKAINFLNLLSKEILSDSLTSSLPELVALAYFLRKSNINSIIESFKSILPDNEIAAPLGVCFQIAPSNVDTIFIYSWTFSLLAGNKNIIRISQNVGEQLSSLISVINRILKKPEMMEIAERNLVLSYPRDENINSYLSSLSDLRIIWGGDETVQSIRKHLAKPTTRDIAFADKLSYAVIDSKYLLSLSETGLTEKVRLFYNDSYYFNQMACSSPQIVYFAGNEQENQNASEIFWNTLNKILNSKSHSDHISVLMNKLTYLYEESARGLEIEVNSEPFQSKPTVVKIKLDDISKIQGICGGGFFHQCFISDILELQSPIKHNDQTLAYLGFDKQILLNLAKSLNGKGIDRIVPFGQALTFMQTWDGFSLLNHFTKRVVII